MARARNIKPGFFRNELLVEMDFGTRLFFIGLWTLADKAGRLEDRPKKIKIELFPADDVDVPCMLHALAMHGFITRYAVKGVPFIQINNFLKHQSPHHKEVESELPGPDQADKEEEKNTEESEFSACTGQAQSMHEPSTDDEQPKESASSPLIPDSLIPDSGYRIPEQQPCAPKAAPRDISAEVLDYLNAKAKRNFRNAPTNTKLILDRTKEGATLEDFKAVIDRKCAEWSSNPEMAQYLRPATLFNAQKFNQYVGQLDAPLPVSNLVDGTSRFAGRQSVDDYNQEVARRWAAGGDCYDHE